MADDLKGMLADIKRAIESDEFTASQWETEFLEKVGELINFELPLTEKQDATLEGIWKKATQQSGGDEPDEDDFV